MPAAEATDGRITLVNRLSDSAKILRILNCRLQWSQYSKLHCTES